MKLKPIAILLLLSLVLIPSVWGDYSDNFDQYPPTTQSPWSPGNPWTLTSDLNASTSPTLAQCFGFTFVTDSNGALSPANVYQFTVPGTAPSSCWTSSHHVNLEISINATQLSVFAQFYLNATFPAPSSGSVKFLASICGGALSGFPLDMHAAVASWRQYNGSGVFISNPCTVDFMLYTVASGPPGAAEMSLDNFRVKGGNSIFSNADLFMIMPNNVVNGAGEWFNVTNFVGTKVIVNYTGTTPAFVLNNVTAPDVYVPLVGAKLVTVYLGTYTVGSTVEQGYRRSIIPTSSTHQVIYMNDPTQQTVVTYTFQVQDFSGEFPPGSTIEILLGTEVMSSGYLDSNHQFTTGLLPGDYSVKLISGANTFDSLISLSPNNPNVIITVPSITITFPNNQQTAISCLGFWTSTTQIEIFYRDATDTTTSVTLTLMILNFTGTVILHSTTFSPGPYGNLTQVLSGSYVNLNNTGAYRVTCTATDIFGSGVVYPSVFGQPVSGGSSSSVNPVFPDVLHLGAVFPGLAQPTTQIGGLGMITAIAATFGEFTGPIGAVVIAFFATFLIGGHWLIISATVGTVFVMITIIGALIWAERRNR
jgi:hypothetical protein